MINFRYFIIALKVKLIYKLFNDNFNHPWKKIVIEQLKFSRHLDISIDCGETKKSEYLFTQDLLNCYRDWRNESMAASNKTPDLCVWSNNLITDIGRKLWNEKLIQQNVYSISDFLDENGDILNYLNFRIKHRLRKDDLSMTEYGGMKLALKRFNNPLSLSKNIQNIDKNLGIRLFINTLGEATLHSSKQIRSKMISESDPGTHTQMTTWKQYLPESICSMWKNIFINLHKASNNYKLIQHHYKILYRIATSRYLRHRFKIETSPNCQHCGMLETLEHIYLYCPTSIHFTSKVHNFIRSELEQDFEDEDGGIRFSCSHRNSAVNFILLVCNWYLGRQFQKGKDLYWEAFIRYAKQFLIGEKHSTTNRLSPHLNYTS